MMSGRQNLGMIIENEEIQKLNRFNNRTDKDRGGLKSANQLFFHKSSNNVASNWKWINFEMFSNHKRSKFVVYFPYIFQNLKTSKIPWHWHGRRHPSRFCTVCLIVAFSRICATISPLLSDVNLWLWTTSEAIWLQQMIIPRY